jgi:TetR/AcrR family transcriptional regulator, transcriptional repressor of aconitase
VPKVSKEHSEARRRQIIDAAYQCFARKGFHQTTMRDIYEEANLSPGAVYHYFDSKDEIIQASFDFDYQRGLDLFSAAIANDDPIKALDDLLDFFLHGLKGAAALGAGRVNVQGWGEALINPRLRETIYRVVGSYRDALSQVICKAQEVGQLDKSLDPSSVSRLLLSIYYGLELQLALDSEIDVDKYVAAAKALLRSSSPQAA